MSASVDTPSAVAIDDPGDRGGGPPPPEDAATAPPAGHGVSVAIAVLLIGSLLVGLFIGAQRKAQRARPSLTGAAPAVTDDGGQQASGQPSQVGTTVSAAVVDITSSVAGGTAAGTGMIVTSSGEVLTNNHVIQGASNIRAQVNGSGPTYTAKVLGYDAADDVALLKLQNVSGLKTIRVGTAHAVGVGDAVVAVGNAGGQAGPLTVTQGSVTALNRTLTAADPGGRAETLSGMIQVNAPIEPGDSGGPLVDAGGKVVGMNTAAARGFRMSATNVGFAVPIDTAMAIAHQIEAKQGSSSVHIGPRGMLGVEVTDTLAPGDGYGYGRRGRLGGNSGGNAGGNGATIAAVPSGTPAAAAGLAAGDVIVSIDGTAIASASDLSDAMDAAHPGDKVVVGWVDGSGQSRTATVTLAAGSA